MSFPRYPKYKPSGVDWLGESPAHWENARLRWLARRYSGGTPDKTNLNYWEGGTIPWLNSGEVNERLITQPSSYITQEAFENSSAKWIPAGSLVMALAGQGKTKGMVAQLAIDSTCNQSMAAIVPSSRLQPRFLLWWLDSNYENIRNMAGGDLRDGLNLELLGNIACPLPPTTEQTRIAEFLDRETSKIDELVAEQRRLMELLKEKRKAVISHAVTRGLNPQAPLKPSGIEWLGEIPSHWDVGPVKHFFVSLDSQRIPLSSEERSFRGGEYPYYGASGVIDNIDAFIFDEDLVLVSEDGANLLNRSTPIAFVATGKYWVNNHAHILRPIDNNLRFWAQRLDIVDITPVVTGSAQPKFTIEALMNLRIAIPSDEEERQEIQRHLDAETAKFDTLTTEAQRAIDLLQERRTALISAAVTGQIDIRASVRYTTTERDDSLPLAAEDPSTYRTRN